MKKYVFSILLLAYSALLVKIIVFKDVPAIRVGRLIFNFGGTETGRSPNFIPFKTIFPYLLGDKGWLIAGINLFGNIGLLVPVGLLIPFVFHKISLKKSLVLAVAAGLILEGMQAILSIGVFDIDDMILNALGVIVGYLIVTRIVRHKA